MKYSFMSFSCPELTLRDMLETAKEYGYDAVEPRVAANHKHGIEHTLDAAGRAAVKEVVADVGVPLCCLATSCRYADPETCPSQVEDTLRYIDLAADVGAPRIRVFGGQIPEQVDREAAVECVSAALLSVADRAAERGVVICMETHDHWCDPDDVAAVMRRVDHPAVRVNWDIMHPVRVAKVTMADAFDVLKRWVRHVHFHDGVTTDGKLVMVPVGEGDIDHKTAVELLERMGYDGYMSGEWINWQPYEEHLPRELATMKTYGKM
jgi:sugar phosphate isomerase/epimerase